MNRTIKSKKLFKKLFFVVLTLVNFVAFGIVNSETLAQENAAVSGNNQENQVTAESATSAAPSTPSESAKESIIADLTKSNKPIFIDKNWQFCPVQDYQPDINVSVLDCHSIDLPNKWETVVADYDGYGLLVNQFDLPKEKSGQIIGLKFARIRDTDKTFINGQLIGEQGDFPPNFQKSVLYGRLYQIPNELLKFGEQNSIKVWVYNDARSGGVVAEAPIINDYLQLLDEKYQQNLFEVSFALVLAIFAFLHLVYFFFHRNTKENFFYATFLITWAFYLYTLTDSAILSGLSMNTLFRLNVSLFFLIFTLLPIFIFCFFQQEFPKPLKIILTITALCIPLCFLLPEPKLLYYPLQFVELLTIPVLIIVYHLLFKAVKAKLPYAKLMTFVIFLYSALGVLDILADFLQIDMIYKLKLLGPWGLLLLSIALTMIFAHKNFVFYKDATTDNLTQALRITEFKKRLKTEFFRADREKKPAVVVMVDMDDFKNINDNFGHIQGDKALEKVSALLRKQLRHFDLFGRYGGDEFCIAALLDDESKIRDFVKRLHQSIKELEISDGEKSIALSTTFGAIIRQPNQNTPIDELLKSADDLLINAKTAQKGTINW